MVLIVILGTYYQDGGFREIFIIADRNNRLEFFKLGIFISLMNVNFIKMYLYF